MASFPGYSTDKYGTLTETTTPDTADQSGTMTRASGDFNAVIIHNYRNEVLYINPDASAVDSGIEIPANESLVLPMTGTDLHWASPDGLWDFWYTLLHNSA